MNDLVFVIIATSIINWIILYLIIGSAVKASSRHRIEWAQMKLLAEIAKKHGVDEALVNDILLKSE